MKCNDCVTYAMCKCHLYILINQEINLTWTRIVDIFYNRIKEKCHYIGRMTYTEIYEYYNLKDKINREQEESWM